MMAVHRRMLPSSIVNPGIGRAFAVGPDAEQRAESVERVEAAVKPEREFIQVGLQVLRLDAPVVRPLQPRLEVRKNEVDDWQKFLGYFRVASFDNGQMRVAAHAEFVIGRRGVRDDHRTRFNGLFYKADQRLSRAVGDDFQPQPASVAAPAPCGLVTLLGRSGSDLDGGGNQNGIIGLGALTLSAHHATNPSFIYFDVIAAPKVAADPVTTLSDHASAQLVQDLERGFVSREAKLALELNGRHARRHAGNEIGRPKPDRQRRVRALHHGIDRERRLLAARPARQNAGPRGHAERLALGVAVRANETLGPLRALKIPRARVVVFEQPLEVPERLGERQVFPLEHIGMGRHFNMSLGLAFVQTQVPPAPICKAFSSLHAVALGGAAFTFVIARAVRAALRGGCTQKRFNALFPVDTLLISHVTDAVAQHTQSLTFADLGSALWFIINFQRPDGVGDLGLGLPVAVLGSAAVVSGREAIIDLVGDQCGTLQNSIPVLFCDSQSGLIPANDSTAGTISGLGRIAESEIIHPAIGIVIQFMGLKGRLFGHLSLHQRAVLPNDRTLARGFVCVNRISM